MSKKSLGMIIAISILCTTTYAGEINAAEQHSNALLCFDQELALQNVMNLHFLLSTQQYERAVDSTLVCIENSENPIEKGSYCIILARAYLFNKEYNNTSRTLEQIDSLSRSMNIDFFDYDIIEFWLAVDTGDVHLANRIFKRIAEMDFTQGIPVVSKKQIMQRAEIYIHLADYDHAKSDLQLTENYTSIFDVKTMFDAAILVYQGNYQRGLLHLEQLLEDDTYNNYCRSFMYYLLAVCAFQTDKEISACQLYDEASQIVADYHNPFLIGTSFHSFPVPILEILDQIAASR